MGFFPSHNNFFFLQGHFRSSVWIRICSASRCRQSCLQPLSSEGEIRSCRGILPKSPRTEMAWFCSEWGRRWARAARLGSGPPLDAGLQPGSRRGGAGLPSGWSPGRALPEFPLLHSWIQSPLFVFRNRAQLPVAGWYFHPLTFNRAISKWAETVSRIPSFLKFYINQLLIVCWEMLLVNSSVCGDLHSACARSGGRALAGPVKTSYKLLRTFWETILFFQNRRAIR